MQTMEERLASYRNVLDTVPDTPAETGAAHSPVSHRRPRRLITIAACVALAAGLISIAVAATHHNMQHDRPAEPAPPLGKWSMGTAPPFTLHDPMQSAVTPTGEVLVLGGTPHAVDANVAYGGGLYDPVTDSWKTFPAAPFTGGATFRLAGTVAMAVTVDNPDAVKAAVLDLTSSTWTTVDIPPEMQASFGIDPWTWDGHTLVDVHTGTNGLPGSSATPSTMRWTITDHTWRQGTAPPLTARTNVIDAVTDTRIGIWSGFTTDATTPGAVTIPKASGSRYDAGGTQLTGVFSDGAVYDVSHDTWTTVTPFDTAALLPTTSADPVALFLGDELTIASSQADPHTIASFSNSWHVLPPSASTGPMATRNNMLIIKSTQDPNSQAATYFDAGTWKQAPTEWLVSTTSGLVAVGASESNPGNGAFQAWLLTDHGWNPITEAPFKNRMEPTVEGIGTNLTIIGGNEGTQLVPRNDTWILQLAI